MIRVGAVGFKKHIRETGNPKPKIPNNKPRSLYTQRNHVDDYSNSSFDTCSRLKPKT